MLTKKERRKNYVKSKFGKPTRKKLQRRTNISANSNNLQKNENNKRSRESQLKFSCHCGF